jgi:hypothetical protein
MITSFEQPIDDLLIRGSFFFGRRHDKEVLEEC